MQDNKRCETHPELNIWGEIYASDMEYSLYFLTIVLH